MSSWPTPAGIARALLAAALLLLAFGAHEQLGAQEKKPTTMRIAGYDYKLPDWWDSVKVDVPEKLKTSVQIDEYVKDKFDKDTGTKETWKGALKVHALAAQRIDRFPVYLAHCHFAGEEYERAAEIFTDLYQLADTQGKLKDWYRCYLAYNAGQSHALLKDTAKAKVWYARSAEYVGNKDDAIAYYANESKEALEALQTKK